MDETKAYVITAETGECREVAPANGRYFSLGEMQGFVGGLIEVVDMGKGWLIVANEESKCFDSWIVNRPATHLLGPLFSRYDVIAGDALAIGPKARKYLR